MSDENIFDSNTNENQQNDATQPQGFTIPTEAVDFIGSGKKYQTPEDALKSVPHAQKHIQTLESELQTLKEELTRRKTAEELLDEMKSGISKENTPQAVEIDPDKIARLIDQTISLKERQKQAQQNTDSVASKFTEQFGENAEEVYNTIAKDAGLTVAQLNSLAASSPSAVLKLAGITKTVQTVPGKNTSSVNTQAFSNNKPTEVSAKVPKGASTRDLVNAWKAAGEKVKQNLSTS
jgi:hypothetical protein